ncbi:hypothetical protein D3C73_1414540 [compost metagenome]
MNRLDHIINQKYERKPSPTREWLEIMTSLKVIISNYALYQGGKACFSSWIS